MYSSRQGRQRLLNRKRSGTPTNGVAGYIYMYVYIYVINIYMYIYIYIYISGSNGGHQQNIEHSLCNYTYISLFI